VGDLVGRCALVDGDLVVALEVLRDVVAQEAMVTGDDQSTLVGQLLVAGRPAGPVEISGGERRGWYPLRDWAPADRRERAAGRLVSG
jgi:hypothetical protein